jgi:4-hydroxybenzoate polyprenyltransferase/predicted HAD superfamily phosphohydrolase YqeG
MKKHFEDIDFSGITDSLVFIDLDGTLVTDHTTDISENVLLVIKNLARSNTVIIATNGSFENASKIASLAGVVAIKTLKPSTRSLAIYLKKNKKRVVIGDKFLTDGIFAKLIGAKFIKVVRKVSKKDSFISKFFYTIDDLVSIFLPFLILIRPWQWVKNLLVFAPIFFAARVFEIRMFLEALELFIIFCFATSIVYVLNDLFDAKVDREHPEKCLRPVASGQIKPKQAILFLFILILIEIALFLDNPEVFLLVTLYILLNVLYSVWLKHVAVVDILVVSSFYIIRVIVGGLPLSIYISPWVILCVFFGSLFVIIGKRRAELRNENKRKVLEQYSKEALDFMLVVSASLAVITYGIYSVIGHNLPNLVYSTIFVVFAFFRMLNRIYTHGSEAESPETMVFKDKWIFGSFILWVIYMFYIFY